MFQSRSGSELSWRQSPLAVAHDEVLSLWRIVQWKHNNSVLLSEHRWKHSNHQGHHSKHQWKNTLDTGEVLAFWRILPGDETGGPSNGEVRLAYSRPPWLSTNVRNLQPKRGHTIEYVTT